MVNHMEDYSDFDLNDMQNFKNYYELIYQFLNTMKNIDKEESDNRLDDLIQKLQKLRDKKYRWECFVNMDCLIDELGDEDGLAYKTFDEVLNVYENGEIDRDDKITYGEYLIGELNGVLKRRNERREKNGI